MNVKRAVMMAVLVVAVAALAWPMLGLRAGATSSARLSPRQPAPSAAVVERAAAATEQPATEAEPSQERQAASEGRVDPELLRSLGITKSASKDASQRIAQLIKNRARSGSPAGDLSPQSGQPVVLNSASALSAAMLTNIGGRDNQFSEVALVADWDGREDCVADREQKVDDFSFAEVEIDYHLTRTGISEHTVANGFGENVYYYGDSVGNFWVGADLNPGISADPGGAVEPGTLMQLNIPELVNTGFTGPDLLPPGGDGVGDVALLNRLAGDCTDDQVTVTGIAVNPVSDLGDFGAAFCCVNGEVVYVSVYDAEGCASNAAGQIFRTRIFAFGFTDGPDGVVPIGAIQILRNPLHNVAGVSVDDDSNLYFQLVDLINTANGGAIFKVTEGCRTRSFDLNYDGDNLDAGEALACPPAGVAPGRIQRVIAAIPQGLNGGIGLTTASVPTAFSSTTNPNGVRTLIDPVTGVFSYKLTNYTGRSTVFGNIVAIDNGPCNVLWAAVARSFNPADDALTQATQGPFVAPSAFGTGAGSGLPSMVISFADCAGLADLCSSAASLLKPDGRLETIVIGGGIPQADGFADVAANGLALNPGVNNYRVFVEGGGPDLRPATGGTSAVPGTPASLLRIPEFQVDFSTYSGLNVSEEGTVFVISGGHPAGTGKNSSVMLGEILCFEDMCPMDRRADFVDLRGDALPNPPASGGNVGDGDSDRFDHIFYQAPLDAGSQFTPAGLSGLSRGFLRYTNRLALTPIALGDPLGVTATTQSDDDTTGQIIFENFDPGHQVAGGDDQNAPFFGDDNDGAGIPPLVGLLSGGFEFIFGVSGVPGSATAPCVNEVWNGFWLGSNGIIGFGATVPPSVGSAVPFVPAFRQDQVIAPAWSDLDPGSRYGPDGVCGTADDELCTFPLQAMGFVNVNAFKIRWINVPEDGFEACSSFNGLGGNTFAVTLYDDGTGAVIAPITTSTPPFAGVATASDENNNKPFNAANPSGNNSVPFDWREGPTDLRFAREPNTNALVGCPPRPAGSGIFQFEYCAMTLIGTDADPVLVGYSVGDLDPTSPPGLCEINLSLAATAADANPFGVVQGVTASFCNCLIGEGTEPTLFEFFNEGRRASIGAGGEAAFATPDFDLRFEGNDPALCTPARQKDQNRGKVTFLGVSCVPNPLCLAVTPVGTVAVAPGQPAVGTAAAGTPGTGSGGARAASPTAGIINAICSVQLNLLGCGFFPNEVTTVCPGFVSETGVPQQRPGKTVTTAVALTCDTNADGVADAVIALTNVTPVNCNLVRATLAAGAAGVTGLPGTPFPAACCGGVATLTTTTTFTAGDNNIFGAFTRVSVCTIDLGLRAPVVFSVTPSDGSCAVNPQNLIVTGACFIINGVPNVTSVFAVQSGNPSNVIGAFGVKVLSPFLLDAEFNFGTANAGRRFLIFVTGPNGTSQNLTALPAGSAGCPAGFLGNQQGVQVTFTCSSGTTPGPDQPVPLDIAVVTSCRLDRDDTGTFVLQIFGRNFKTGLSVTVDGKVPSKAPKLKDLDTATQAFTRISVKKACKLLGGPGTIIVTNPGPNGRPSAPFACTEKCPTN